jgi:type IV pilus assembly protein PilX
VTRPPLSIATFDRPASVARARVGAQFPSRARGEVGLALVAVLVTLVGVSVLALSSLQTAALGARLSGASHDHAIALQAAQAALRDARLDLAGVRADGAPCPAGSPGCREAGERPIDEKRGGPGDSIASPDCVRGQCVYATHAASAPWRRFLANGCDPAATVRYGTYTQARAIPGVAEPPCYLLELVRAESDTPDGRYLVRITVRATGATPGTVIFLQQTLSRENA